MHQTGGPAPCLGPCSNQEHGTEARQIQSRSIKPLGINHWEWPGLSLPQTTEPTLTNRWVRTKPDALVAVFASDRSPPGQVDLPCNNLRLVWNPAAFRDSTNAAETEYLCIAARVVRLAQPCVPGVPYLTWPDATYALGWDQDFWASTTEFPTT
jgi:hypothetical protein